MVIYLDDGIGAAQGKLKVEQDALTIQSDLFKAGFVTNLSKCKWSPSQQCIWLDLDIDLQLGKVAVPQEKFFLSKHSYPKH